MKKGLGIIAVGVLVIAILWGTEVIPKGIAYGDYIVSFAGEDGTVYNFRLFSGRFPFSVVYDSIKRSVV